MILRRQNTQNAQEHVPSAVPLTLMKYNGIPPLLPHPPPAVTAPSNNPQGGHQKRTHKFQSTWYMTRCNAPLFFFFLQWNSFYFASPLRLVALALQERQLLGREPRGRPHRCRGLLARGGPGGGPGGGPRAGAAAERLRRCRPGALREKRPAGEGVSCHDCIRW